MSTQPLRFKHSGNLGDVVYALPSIKKYCAQRQTKAIVHLVVGAPMWLPSDFSHPSGNVMLTERGVEMLKPLLLAQDYVADVVFEKYRIGQNYPCDVDLDTFRAIGKFNLAMGSIARYYQTIFGFAPDAELPWLNLPPAEREDYIVVARSSRYRNPNLDYAFLRGWGVKFVGVDSEYADFAEAVPDAEYVKCPDFLELAVFLSKSRLVIANQTFIYSIAEALKLDRVLEPCLYAGNVIPCGGNNFEAFTQESFEFAVNTMSGRGLKDVDGVEYLSVLRPWQDFLASRNVLVEEAVRPQNGASPALPRLLVVVDATDCSEREALETIASLREQQLRGVDVLVVSLLQRPTPLAEPAQWVAPDDARSHIDTMLAANGPDTWLLEVKGGDQVTASGLLSWAREAARAPDKALYYADEDVLDPVKGPLAPQFKPDFDPDYLLAFPYIGRFLVCRAEEWRQLDGMRGQGSARYLDYVLRFFEQYGAGAIGHLPEVAFHGVVLAEEGGTECRRVIEEHLSRRGGAAEVDDGTLPGTFRIRYLHDARPLVSIVIPTRNQMEMLSRCIETLTGKTAYGNYEILLVDNQSSEPDAKEYLHGIENLGLPQLRVLSYPGEFNFSAMNNMAVREARGEYLVLLNNDTAVIKADWLDALLNHALRPKVGIVGAKLLFPDGGVQHAGVVLGLRGPADHPFLNSAMSAPGYMGRLQLDQQYSAVTAACLMIRKAVYEQVGGFDEKDFRVSYNDVDLCLKVREAGYAVVWTPHALVMHVGSASQKSADRISLEANRKRFAGEQRALYRKWMPLLKNDPAYNRNFSLSGMGFEIELDPLFAPLASGKSKILAHHGDELGAGTYRVIAPLTAMVDQGLASGRCSLTYFDPVPVAKIAPTSIILQRQITDAQLVRIKDYREFSGAKLIYELDDYLPNLPVASVHKSDFPKDTLKRMRAGMNLCDRVVVSTDALKDALSGLHPDIRVLPNYLPPAMWQGIGQRRELNPHRRPRVGWAGGAGHAGDLRLIADVVKALADRVDWVFFGMLPEEVRAFVAEYHPGIPLASYPEKLASLDLDLAVAPLDGGLFNECKSNLRLLEYGICGYPVIASDGVAYRCGFPVTLVRNRFKDWVAAIEEKIAEREALWNEGLALQAVVRRDWMLEGGNLARWLDGWMLASPKP